MTAIAAMEPIGTIETWQTNSGSDLDEPTPLVSGLGGGAPFVGPDSTPILGRCTTARWHNAVEGSVWVPWAFQPAIGVAGLGVSSVGLGAIASGIVLLVGGATGIVSTLVLPARGVMGLLNPGQLLVDTTPLWEEVGAITLVTPGLRPRVLRLAESSELSASRLDQRTDETLLALSDLMRWLNRSRDEIAGICRFSLRASRYWDAGKTPRPRTVRRLFEVHAFVGSLVRSMGAQRARAWLDQTGPRGAQRTDELATDEGVRTLLREANRILFRDVPLPEIGPPETIEAEVAAASAESYQPADIRAQPRRPRRPPPSGG